jgi:GNAT superfamily N-acetyltransferase
MMRKMLRRDSTSRRCSSSSQRRDAVASTMMVVLLFLLPLPSNSFQSPKIAARNLQTTNLLHAIKGQDTIIKTVPNVEVATPFVMANNEKSEKKSEEMRSELTDGTEGRNADEDQRELAPEPDGGDDNDNNDGDNKEAIRRKAMASLLLSGNAGSRRSTARDTSVGARRVGSASKGRGGIPKTSQLLTAVRRAANAAAKSIDDSTNATKISQIAIDTSIESFLERNAGMDYTKQMVSPTQMGVLGAAAAADEATMATSHPLLRKPQPGTLLIQPKKVERSNSIMSKESLIVRVATHFYDMDIASLRLSVFSDFSPAMRQQFSSRARQVLSNRRRRGAMCLVATIPAKSRRKDGRTDIVLGRIECSVHEFYGTLLGRRRKENSVLYITEVAVNPLYRRCGIGTKLLEVSQKTPMFCFQKLLLFKARLTLIVILKRESMNWLPNTAIMLNHCICMLM